MKALLAVTDSKALSYKRCLRLTTGTVAKQFDVEYVHSQLPAIVVWLRGIDRFDVQMKDILSERAAEDLESLECKLRTCFERNDKWDLHGRHIVAVLVITTVLWTSETLQSNSLCCFKHRHNA